MRFLLNENISGAVIRLLRDHGHDVLSVKESMRGEDDAAILARAQAEQRVVVSHDKDFGELAFRCGLSTGSGVVLFRLSGCGSDSNNRRVVEVLESRTDWLGSFAVVSDDRIRIRPLPF